MRRLLTLLLIIVAAGAAAASTEGYATYPELDETATWLAQRPVEVHCLTREESDSDLAIALYGATAYVEITEDDRPENHTVFSHGICERLLALHHGTWKGRYSLSSLGWAALVITHESGHLRGWAWWKNEARVNCWALRHVRYTALHLGASDDLAWALRSWAHYAFRKQPIEYRLSGCRIPFP